MSKPKVESEPMRNITDVWSFAKKFKNCEVKSLRAEQQGNNNPMTQFFELS